MVGDAYSLVVEVHHLLPELEVLHERRSTLARPELPLLCEGPADVGRHVVIVAVANFGVLKEVAGLAAVLIAGMKPPSEGALGSRDRSPGV